MNCFLETKYTYKGSNSQHGSIPSVLHKGFRLKMTNFYWIVSRFLRLLCLNDAHWTTSHSLCPINKLDSIRNRTVPSTAIQNGSTVHSPTSDDCISDCSFFFLSNLLSLHLQFPLTSLFCTNSNNNLTSFSTLLMHCFQRYRNYLLWLFCFVVVVTWFGLILINHRNICSYALGYSASSSRKSGLFMLWPFSSWPHECSLVAPHYSLLSLFACCQSLSIIVFVQVWTDQLPFTGEFISKGLKVNYLHNSKSLVIKNQVTYFVFL